MNLSIASKYRPVNFSQVVGQGSTVKILRNSILMGREIKSMLITGIRGTGKTTLARIYAGALNCENFNGDLCGSCSSCLEYFNKTHADILEFDAASNNGVAFVRDLETIIRQVPVYSRRVVIFDEAHMFTKEAQAALLKTIEDPPKNLTFIFVTTNPDNLQDTIRSRCLSMPLNIIVGVDIEKNVRHILQEEGKQFSEEFVKTMGLFGGGSLRDVQQILDKCILASGEGPVDTAYLEDFAGIVSVNQYKLLAPVLSRLDIKFAIEAVESWYEQGHDLQLLLYEGVPNLLRDFMVVLSGSYRSVDLLSGIPAETMKKRLTLSYEQVRWIVEKWEETLDLMKSTHHPKVIWQMFLINICNPI